MELIEKYLSENNISQAIFESSNLKYNNLSLLLTKINDHHNFVEKKIRIKMLCNWTSSKNLCNLWDKMSKGNYTWNNITIVWEEPCDYIVVINSTTDVPCPEKTIFFLMEPITLNLENSSKYLKIFQHDVFTYNNIEWHLSKTYTELIVGEIIKDSSLSFSTVLSSKYKEPGHIKRVEFVKFLENKGVNIDVFGENTYNYKNYKGSLPSHCKDNALFPYKYTFNVENNSIPGYTTEKLIDGILSECLVFYSGNYNFGQVIDERSYIYLDLINFEEDYKKIIEYIRTDEWSRRIHFIRTEKQKILNELQFFPRLEKYINSIRGE